jgi:hypothetical protein
VEDIWTRLRRLRSSHSDTAMSNAWGGSSLSLPRGVAGFIEDLWLRLVRRQPTGES